MKKSVIVMGLIWVAAAAQAFTVSEIASLYREQAAREPACVITGIVSCVVAWQTHSFDLVDREDPNGPGIYVGGDLPDAGLAVVEGTDRLEIGDVVEVSGRVAPFMLEPGIKAAHIRVIGHCELAPPPERRVADLMSGRFNNRRSNVKGVLRSVKVGDFGKGGVTELVIGTADGPITANLRGEWPDLHRYRDAEISVDGVCVPSYNARAEFLRPEIEAFSIDAIHLVPFHFPAPLVTHGDGPGRATGVMAWTPDGMDGHLRRLRGEVTYVSERERFFVLQADTAVRVELDEGELPKVGDEVVADGFPVMSGDSGALASASFQRIGRMEKLVVPSDLRIRDLDKILAYGDPGEFDCHYRLVRLRGRITSANVLPDGRTELNLLVGNHRLTALLEASQPGLAARLVDQPLADLTGVVKVRYDTNIEKGRGLSIQDLTLLMRAADDLVILPDSAARGRRFMRIGRTIGLWSLIPMAALAFWMRARAIRQRERSAAVAEDRKRMAEELHDTIAQYLSGARLLLFSVQAESAALSEASRGAVSMAGDILETARRELRDKILNLQSDELMLRPIVQLLKGFAAKANATSGARVRTLLRGLPADMPAQMKNDVLATVQEAVTNAVKHGHARRIAIVSDPIVPDGYALSVLNDGAKFDASSALGPETGHFGLSSMRERAARNGFVLKIGERKGWTEVRLERRG